MSSGAHLSKELFDLIKSIGESRSKQEEDKIIVAEVEKLKGKISTPNIGDKRMKEYLLRAIYIEMLGHDASFAHIHAVNIARSNSIMAKRVGYMACTLFLTQESPLLLLLVATLQRDLQSANYLEVSAALQCLAKVVNSGMMPTVQEYVVKLQNHHNEVVRKKAVTVLHKFVQLAPSMVHEYADGFRRALCDKDPSVMGVSLNFFYDVMTDDNMRTQFKDLVSSFVVILKQIIDHRLPRDYDYHRLPAPWLQIRLLEILGKLGADDKNCSEQMYEILGECMRRADDTGINAGYAIVYQCLQTITEIYPNPQLLESAAQSISRFITSDNHNLKYTGITGLISIVKINPSYAAKHQMVLIDCLEDTDETLKKKTIELLFIMANYQNVDVIIQKLMGFINTDQLDQHTRGTLAQKVLETAEKYAPDTIWFINITITVFIQAGDLITSDLVDYIVRLLNELRSEPDICRFCIDQFTETLETKNYVPDSLMQLSAWVLGEFGVHETQERHDKITHVLLRTLNWNFDDYNTKGWIVTALTKLARGAPTGQLRETMSRLSASRSADIQQRCYEYAGTCTRLSDPVDFSDNLSMNIDNNLSFLDDYVALQLHQGARPYMSERNRFNIGLAPRSGRSHVTEEFNASAAFEALRMDPYEAPRRNDFLPPVSFSTPQVPVTTNSGLNVKQRVWSKEGYLGNTPQPEEPVHQRGPTPSYTSPIGAPTPQYVPEPVQYSRPNPPPPPQKSQKDLEKERLAASLFMGVSGGVQADPYSGYVQRQQNPPQRQQPQQPPQNYGSQGQNLLDFQFQQKDILYDLVFSYFVQVIIQYNFGLLYLIAMISDAIYTIVPSSQFRFILQSVQTSIQIIPYYYALSRASSQVTRLQQYCYMMFPTRIREKFDLLQPLITSIIPSISQKRCLSPTSNTNTAAQHHCKPYLPAIIIGFNLGVSINPIRKASSFN